MDASDRLTELAEAVADGRPVEWDTERTSVGHGDLDSFAELQILAEIARLHREVHDSRPHAQTRSGPEPAAAARPPELFQWGTLSVRERIGSGSFGEVYRAWDPSLQREVALKLFRSAATPADTLAHEGQLLARVRHENVMTVYGAQQHGSQVGMWSELLSGRTLADIVRQDGPLSAPEATIYVDAVCRALAAVHLAGLLHRDIKAQNVMRESGGRIVLMDLGLGREATQQLPAGFDLAGTPMYLAPELFAGGSATVRSDIYSVGVLMFFLVTGQYPVSADNMEELRDAHRTGKRRSLIDLRPDLPAPFVHVVERALMPDPAGRFESAGSLQQAVVRATGDQPLVGIHDAADVAMPSQALLHAQNPARAVTEAANHSGGHPRPKRWTSVWMAVAAAGVLIVAGFATRPWRHPPAPTPAVQSAVFDSIAVLPLENLSGDPNQDYIADGMTESIIAELGRVRSLRVISRQSMMQFKHTRATVPQIASQLGVAAVMTGSITRDGDRLRVTVAVMQPSPERQLWADTYERTSGDVLTLSSEVAQAAVKTVRVQVTPAEEAQLAQVRPMKPDAQQEYLLGRFAWNKRTKADNEAAMRHFQRAIQLDSSAARAYAGLADCYIVALDRGWVPPPEAYRAAKANASKALELDNNLAEAHATLGNVYYLTLLFPQAEEEFKRALALNPGYATARQWYSIQLRTRGRFSEAVAEARHALDLDPVSPVQNLFLANQLYYAGDYDAAVAQINKSLTLAPDSAIAHQLLGATYVQQKNYDAAIRELQSATRIDESDEGYLGHAYAVSGNRAAATRILDDLLRRSQREYVRPLQVAFIYVGLGEANKALDYLERAYRDNEGIVSTLATDPRLAALSGNPRFQSILRRGGLTYRQDLAAH